MTAHGSELDRSIDATRHARSIESTHESRDEEVLIDLRPVDHRLLPTSREVKRSDEFACHATRRRSRGTAPQRADTSNAAHPLNRVVPTRPEAEKPRCLSHR